MLQAEADLRCPPPTTSSSSSRCASCGRTVEYVLYPDEYHVYAIAGRPDRRIDRQTRMLAWFDRYLRGLTGRRRQLRSRRRRAGGAAARWPARAARWSDAGERSPGRARREPADEEPGIERVAGPGRVGRRDALRGDLEAEPLGAVAGQDGRALRARA